MQVIAETVTEEGDPRSAICEAVQKLNITLLVMGERGIGKIKRFVSLLKFHLLLSHRLTDMLNVLTDTTHAFAGHS